MYLACLLTIVDDEWKGEEYRIEERVEDFPENAANWAGNKVSQY